MAADTRTVILDAAVEIASLHGLEELSIGGLASAVQMSKSGLFAHFGSKQELQLATVAEAWGVFESEVLEDPSDDPGGVLDRLIERWLSFYEREVFAGGCFFVIAAVEIAGRESPVAGALRETVDKQLQALEDAVRSAAKAGELHARRDPLMTAFALHSLLINADAVYQVQGDKAIFLATRAALGDLLASY